jgi:hypothetical protein
MVGRGYARYEPGQRALVWRINSFPGSSEAILQASVDLLPATREKVWTRPPITLDFNISMFSASGIQVLHKKLIYAILLLFLIMVVPVHLGPLFESLRQEQLPDAALGSL